MKAAAPRRLPSGSWHIRWTDSSGGRRAATVKSYVAARAALRRRTAEIDDIKVGRRDPGTDRTFAEVATSFLEARAHQPGADPRRAEARLTAYRSHLDRQILPAIGALPLAEINADVIDRLVATLAARQTARRGERNTAGRKVTPATIRNVLTTFRVVMKYARRPVSVELPKGLRQERARARKRPAAIAVAADVARYLDACRPEWFRVASALAIYSGLRRGEIAALRWSAVDIDAGVIRVVASWSGAPKNDQPRVVPCPPELVALLRRWRLASGAAADHVVTRPGKDERPRPLHEGDDLASAVRRTCKRAGIPPVNFHGLRATFGTHAGDAGIPIGQLRAIMGHADITTTAIYVRSDSEVAAADPRVRLSFTRPLGTVVPMVSGNGLATADR